MEFVLLYIVLPFAAGAIIGLIFALAARR